MNVRILLGVCGAFVVTLSSSCGVLEVPFAPTDGAGGASGGSLGTDDLGGAGAANELGGAGGSFGGTLPTGGQFSTDGGAPAAGDGGGGTGGGPILSMDLLIHAPSKITGVGIAGEHVYWTEYGTVDELDNYRFDGVLRRMPVDDEESEVVLDGLEGPVSSGFTSAETYILCERSTLRTSEGAPDLVRAPLSGGPVEIVPNHLDYEYSFRMTAFEDRAYFFLKREGGWTVHESGPEQSVRQLLPILRKDLPLVDGVHAYFSDDGLWRQRLDGAADSVPELVSGEKIGATPQGNRLLATRGKNPTYIASLPKEGGGVWTNILRLDRGDCGGIMVSGDRFATSCGLNTFEPYLLTGLLDGTGAQRTYALSRDQFFAMTEDVLFIAKGRDLYRANLD